MVDTLGLLVAVTVTAANVDDGAAAPGVVGKLAPEAFPRLELEAAGWYAAVHGQKTYNGVAILARTPPEDVNHHPCRHS